MEDPKQLFEEIKKYLWLKSSFCSSKCVGTIRSEIESSLLFSSCFNTLLRGGGNACFYRFNRETFSATVD